jgi:hypothetical protein
VVEASVRTPLSSFGAGISAAIGDTPVSTQSGSAAAARARGGGVLRVTREGPAQVEA